METFDWAAVCQLIRNQVRCYRDLLSLAKEERQILAARQRARLKEIMDRQAVVLHELGALEAAWRQQMRRSARQQAARAESLTIGGCVSLASGAQAQALQQLRQELLAIHAELKQINAANTLLLEKLRTQNDAQIRLYLTPQQSGTRYDRQGTLVGAGCVVCDGQA